MELNRTTYSLDHHSFNVGAIGSLQTVSCVPVVAGDSMQMDFQGLFRLAPLVRNLYLDAKLDLFAFYVPYRHIYGDDWTAFIKDGVDEATTFGTYTATDVIRCTGAYQTGTIPKWNIASYARIWNRYFRHPTDANQIDDDHLKDTGDSDIAQYGMKCTYLKRIWNTGVDEELVDADHILDTTADKLDLFDLVQTQNRLETERQREWFGQRYADVMRNAFGTNVNIDADERPELIMRTSQWLSGHDVDGTASDNLGKYAGKAYGVGELSFPMKFFPEHGSLWLMALIRFPSIPNYEKHYLYSQAEPSYKVIAGDPDVVANEPPIVLDVADYIENATCNDAGLIPYAQWYREHPSYVHDKYRDVTGHPFISKVIATADDSRYITAGEYDNIFQTEALKHWNLQGHIGLTAKRVIPDPKTSIFAGVDR